MLQIVWLMLLAVHTGAAAVWWWLMPGGFPSGSSEFWVNQVGPFVAIAVLLTALFARGRAGHLVLPPVLATIPVFWMAFGISARIIFLESFRSSWSGPFIAGAVLAILWANQIRPRVRAWWLVPLLVVPAALAGWGLPTSQRAPDPATTPAGTPFAAAPAGNTDPRVIRLSKDAQAHPSDGRVVIRRDKLILNVQPLLSFANRSPDRCWTALAEPEMSRATNRVLTSKAHDATHWTLYYRDEDASVLDLAARDGAITLDARSRLAQPIFSHTNSFGELAIQGHRKLSVSFSPVPQTRVEVPPATAAARFAYIDAAGVFHIVLASQRQRGPFTEIASGPLKRGEPLVVTIYDGDKAAFTVTLDDWAAQASTQLSPTAGWGLPVNAIEMMRGGDPETSPALISFTLASTGIGRGTHSVGHAAGVYRNRITVKLPP